MRVLALLALLQITSAPRIAGKSHGVHDAMLDGVAFPEYGQSSMEGSPAPADALFLEPPSLEFGARPLGVANAARIVLFNRSNSTLRLASISGSTQNFHASFFDSKVVPPQGNTTFNVVFLARREGPVDSHLYLHTSIGSHKYSVSGTALMSEYRLSPLLGVKLPLNASFSSTIRMHNPHDYPIQITEVYSSGGTVSLELPDGGMEGPQSLWLLPPHTTRPVVRVHYIPPRPSGTAYIRIKLNGTHTALVVPVDVTVDPEMGPYVEPHAVDAGFGGTRDPPLEVVLEARGRGRHAAALRGGGGSSGAVPPVRLQLLKNNTPRSAQPAGVATLTFYWDRIYESGVQYGEVSLMIAEHCVTVPYRAIALPGTLAFNTSALSFVTSTHDVMMTREFTVRNEFAGPLHVTDVEMSEDVQKHFVLSGFTPRSIPPGATVEIFSLRLREYNAAMTLSSHLTLVTNITTYRVPVYVYSGRLDLEWNWPNWSEDSLDLGAVTLSHTTHVTAVMSNGGPVDVCLTARSVDMEGAAMQLLECVQPADVATCACIPAGGKVLLGLTVVAPAREGTVRGRLRLETPHSRHSVAVSMRAARGRLSARPLKLTNCFPSTACSDTLQLESSLSFRMQLLNVTSDPPDLRIYHMAKSDDGAWDIPAHSDSSNGRVYFEPSATCGSECYTGLRFNSTAQLDEWLDLTATEDWITLEAPLYTQRTQMFANLTRTPVNNVTLHLRTSQVYNHRVDATVVYSWPTLAPRGGAASGLVSVGAESRLQVALTNPSTLLGVYVSIVLARDGLKIPSVLYKSDCEEVDCVWSPSAFRIVAVHAGNSTVVDGRDAPALYLPPRGVASVELQFVPKSAVLHKTVLLLRNNLTMIEIVQISGQGAYPSFKFGNRKPGSATPLLFDLTEKHLKDCERDRTRLSGPPNLTVRRTFTARNTGVIPIIVSSFYINGFECEGYGFKVLNCASFQLNPNGTHKVDIAFTPDFTLSKIKRTLIIVSSLSAAVNYSLVTTVPSHLLAPCSAVLARPPWETYVRNLVVSFMICIGFCVLAAGFMESERILKMATAALSRNTPVQPPLDLRNIGQCKPWEWSDPPDRQKPKTTWNDERRLSEEKIAKYEEVATQKSKKKLPKKYSLDQTSTELPQEKDAKEKKEDDWKQKVLSSNIDTVVDNKSEDGNNSTPPSEIRDTAPLVAQSEMQIESKILDLPKKILASLSSEPSIKKRHAKSERRQNRCEEDASSTATESSNNEEPEKEPETQTRVSAERNVSKKSSPANSKKKCLSQYKDSYEGDGEDEEYDRPNKPSTSQNFPVKLQRNKDSNTPTPTRQTKTPPNNQTEFAEKPKSTEVKSESPQQESVNMAKPKVSTNKLVINKKDKVAKKKTDKVYPTVKTEMASCSNQSRNSPPVVPSPTNCWGENRATFSDVVSRSETSTFSTVVAPKRPEKLETKPKETVPGLNLFVNKKEKTPLGPIGSNFAQKRSPAARPEESDSLYSNPIHQITDPAVKFENLVPTDNNNSFFYFGNDNVRSSEMVTPREVGVIGMPNVSTFPTPIGQTYGQTRYSPSSVEGGRIMADARMDFDSRWEQRNSSPGLIAPNSTSGVFNRSIYSGESETNLEDLWDMPTTTSGVGAVGQPCSTLPAATHGNTDLHNQPWYNSYQMYKTVRPPPGFSPKPISPPMPQPISPPMPQPVQPIAQPYSPFNCKEIWTPINMDPWSKRGDDNQQQ